MLRRLILTITIALLLSPTVSAGPTDGPKPAVGLSSESETSSLPQSQTRLIWLPLVQTPAPATPQSLEELISPSFDYASWYETETGYAGNPEFFGAYAMTPVGDTLYLGFGTARPAEDGNDGALLASSDAISVTAISPLDEQGFIDITPHDGVLYIPGADPTDQGPEHQWDWGNTYVYPPPDSIIKHRNLPNVIHSWGLWRHETHLYAAVSSHFGDYKTFTGEVFVSPDDGENWTRLANIEDGVGDYRTYDITGFGGKLYATWNDVYMEPCGLAVSATEGLSWQRIEALSLATACRPRLFEHQDRLLILTFDRSGIFSLAADDSTTSYAFPDFSVRDWAYNYLASDDAGYLYTLTHDGRVVRTQDLQTWETLISTDRAFMAVAYWPDRNWLILADRGRDYAKVWRIDLSTASSINLPPSPAVSAKPSNGGVSLDWSDSTSAYRVYRSESPFAASHLSNLIAETTRSSILISVNEDENSFYVVRSEDASSNLSLESNRIGVFHFALTPG